MDNPFSKPARVRVNGIGNLASDFVPVVPSDTVNFDVVAMGLYIGTGGTLSFVTAAGETRSLTVPDGFKLECGIMRVNAAGTAAADIHAYIL